MKKLFQNKFMLFSVLGGVIVFSLLAFVILSLGATTKAVVLNADANSGTTITQSMVKEIDIPKDTPGNFYKSATSVIGERIVNNISKDQLIYPSDLMSSVEIVGGETNDDNVTTSIILPYSQALGGLLAAGDVVDISVVPNDAQALARALPDFNINPAINGGIYYILSNVTLLDTTTSLSSAQGSSLSTVIGNEANSSEGNSYYLLSLSYNDFKKLRLAEQYGKVYLNLSPKQNRENAPLLKQMASDVVGGLTDSATGENVEGKNPVESVIGNANNKQNAVAPQTQESNANNEQTSNTESK